VAVGGPVRALARIVAARTDAPRPTTLHRYELTAAELASVRDELVEMDLAARLAVPGMRSRRADHVHVASVVMARSLQRFGVDGVIVSTWGLREGLLLDVHGAG
jgi:exopolyphosphatase / guanosine-5'-triphosphate,3'-diphosphate pyrophosphatase